MKGEEATPGAGSGRSGRASRGWRRVPAPVSLIFRGNFPIRILMKELIRALYQIRTGAPRDFVPATDEERELCRYFEASQALHRGDARGYERAAGPGWSSALIEELDSARRALYRIDGTAVLAQCEQRMLLERAVRQPGPHSIWLLETLTAYAFLCYRSNRLKDAERHYEQVLRIAEREEEPQRASDALSNLGGLATLRDDRSRLESLCSKAREHHERTGLSTFLWTLSDLDSDACLLRGDLAGIEAILVAQDRAPSRVDDGQDQISAFNGAWLALQLGRWQSAQELKERVRRCFAAGINLGEPFALRMLGLMEAARLHDPQLAALVPSHDLAHAGFGRDRLLAVAYLASCAARGRASDERSWENHRLRIVESLAQGPWAPAIESPLELALARLDLRQGLLDEAAASRWEERALSAIDRGRVSDSIAIGFFLIESEVARGELGPARQRLEGWITLAVREGFELDRDMGECLLSSLRGSSASPLADRPGGIAARNLLGQWPWRREAASDVLPGPRGGASLPQRKAERMLEILRTARGAFVSQEAMTRKLWSEEFDPFVHPNRLYQLVKQARSLLRSSKADPQSLVSSYGEGYALRAATGAVSRAQVSLDKPRGDLVAALLDRIDSSPAGGITAGEVSEELGITRRHALRVLGRLEEQGAVESLLKGKTRLFRRKVGVKGAA